MILWYTGKKIEFEQMKNLTFLLREVQTLYNFSQSSQGFEFLPYTTAFSI